MMGYRVNHHWSAADEAFIAEVPELPGCITHGATREEAVVNAEEAIQGWVDTAREFGDPIPEPNGGDLKRA